MEEWNVQIMGELVSSIAAKIHVSRKVTN